MTLENKREKLLKHLPKAICNLCGKPIEDEDDVTPIQYLPKKDRIYRLYHSKCNDAQGLSQMFSSGMWKKERRH
jgi:hypothetical protein